MDPGLAAVVAGVLGLQQVSVTTNFFDLGANSILMMRIYTQLQDAFPNQKLAIVDLFSLATVRSLAEHFANDQPEAATTTGQEGQQRGQSRLAARQQSRRRRGR